LSIIGILTILALPACRDVFKQGGAQRLALSLVAAVVVISGIAAEPAFYQLSPRAWLRSSQFQGALDLSKHERLYSFGSEAYVASFYLEKPFFSAVPGLPPGSIIVVEQRNIERLKQEIAPSIREVARFSSGLEPAKKDLVVVEVLTIDPTSVQ
jgi:hypothetical protein